MPVGKLLWGGRHVHGFWGGYFKSRSVPVDILQLWVDCCWNGRWQKGERKCSQGSAPAVPASMGHHRAGESAQSPRAPSCRKCSHSRGARLPRHRTPCVARTLTVAGTSTWKTSTFTLSLPWSERVMFFRMCFLDHWQFYSVLLLSL